MASPPTDGLTPDDALAHPRHRSLLRYTRIVRLLRWLLPLCALALAVFLLLWPTFNLIELPDVIPISGLEQPTAERSTMTNVRFLGTDSDGRPFTIRARTAWHGSDRDDMVFLEGVSGSITVGEGEWTSLEADSGYFEQKSQVLTLESSVQVISSSGYRLESERVLIDLERGMAHSDAMVRGTGPSGDLAAEGFVVSDHGGKFTFSGDVEISLQPGD